jgi:hypothetical protein
MDKAHKSIRQRIIFITKYVYENKIEFEKK